MKPNQNHEATCDYFIHFQRNLEIQMLKKVAKDRQGWERLGETWGQSSKCHEILTEISEGL